MPSWLKAPVSKTGSGVTQTWVQIPPSPPTCAKASVGKPYYLANGACVKAQFKEQAEGKSQDEGARFFEPVALAASQLKSELSNNKQIGFRNSDHHVEIHLGKERKVKVEVFRHGAGHKFHAVEEVEYEHPEHQVPNRDLIFETSGEIIHFLVKVCAEFIVSQNE